MLLDFQDVNILLIPTFIQLYSDKIFCMIIIGLTLLCGDFFVTERRLTDQTVFEYLQGSID